MACEMRELFLAPCAITIPVQNELSPERGCTYDSVRSFPIDCLIAFRNNFTNAFVGAAGGNMDIQTKYGWQGLYATALLETDWSKIDQKIQVAENG